MQLEYLDVGGTRCCHLATRDSVLVAGSGLTMYVPVLFFSPTLPIPSSRVELMV